MNLQSLGWNAFFEGHFRPHLEAGLLPARVAVESRKRYALFGTDGGLSARCSGRFLHHVSTRSEMPAVGDWVAYVLRSGTEMAEIRAVLPRRTRFSRNAAGLRTGEQVIAANIDTLFLVTGLDANFNLRRIERYLAVADESGAEPVIILNKTDICEETAARVAEVEAIAGAVPVIAISAATGAAIETVRRFIRPAETVALIGSSGVGKSTLANQLLGEAIQYTGEARVTDGRGRHNTTARNLIPIPSGGVLIDTPGMRELGFWDVGSGVKTTFEDIGQLALRCRFNDCRHQSEPGCAVREALENGDLDRGRFQNWRKLLHEESLLKQRQEEALRRRQAVDRARHAASNQKHLREEDERSERP